MMKISIDIIDDTFIPADKLSTAGTPFSYEWWELIVDNKIDFNEIFKENKDRIFNFILRSTGDYHLTEDIFQDVFLKAYRNLNTFREESSISTWLFTIAVNRIKDEKRRKFNLFRNIDIINLNIKSNNKSPEAEIIEKENMATLQKELNKLKDSIKIPMILFYYEDLPIKEISKIIGKSIENIKVLLYRGRKTLSKKLKKAGYEI